MGIRKTSIAIDEELLAAAKEVLATSTIRETVEKALLEALRAEARRQERRALSQMDGLDLADEEIMSQAWGH
jgi:Arc/MetJ family transcription regulator